MSKTMRTRNLDPNKPMVIYDATKEELPDRIENPAIVRTNTNLPTGMEKEEETERHFQEALTGATKPIRTPPILELEKSKYDQLYPSGYVKDAELYRVQGLSAGPEPDVVDYCADEADDQWLRQTGTALGITIDRFEFVMDRLEKHTGAQVLKEDDAVKLFGERNEHVATIYDYWLSKRHRLKHPLISRVRTETRRDAASGHDPYVAFRRRAEKMQTRKNRKSDEQNFILMHKMKVSHTQWMKDGLMDILQTVKERELLKLRASVQERHEFQQSSVLLDDYAGDYCNHVINHYPELSRLEAENAYDHDQENEEDEDYASGEEKDDQSVGELSEISDSDSISDESWSDMPASSNVDRRTRSSGSDMESEARFAVPTVHDENLVTEAQYKLQDPPEHWSADGQFTFVRRKDCNYYLDTPPRSDDEEDPSLEGFSLQDIPVIIDGRTVMKAVLGRRILLRNRVSCLEYYPLPENLSGLDLQLLLTNPDLASGPEWDIVQKEKSNTYVHSQEAIQTNFPVAEDSERNLLTDEFLEEFYKFVVLRTATEASTALEEDEDLYQIACDSVAQPILEHNYCKPFIPPDVIPTVIQEAIIEVSSAALAPALDDGSSGDIPSTPETLGEGEAAPTLISGKVDNLLNTDYQSAPNPPLAKKKAPAPRKPKVQKAATVGIVSSASTVADKPQAAPIYSVNSLKRPSSMMSAPVGGLPENGSYVRKPEPPKKRARMMDNAKQFQLAYPPVPLTPKAPPAKRKIPSGKQDSGPVTAELINGGDSLAIPANKKPKRSATPASSRKPTKLDEAGVSTLSTVALSSSLPILAVSGSRPLILPQRPILPVPSAGYANVLSAVTPNGMTFTPSGRPGFSASAIGTRVTNQSVAPNLQALLSSHGAAVEKGVNGYHNGPAAAVVAHSQKLC